MSTDEQEKNDIKVIEQAADDLIRHLKTEFKNVSFQATVMRGEKTNEEK